MTTTLPNFVTALSKKFNFQLVSTLGLLLLLLTSNLSFGQTPYMQTGAVDGLGQYGYLEKDATTFVRLNSNTYGNIYQLFARTFVNSNNVLTYGTAVNSCSGSGIVQNTNNLNFDVNAVAGQIAYTSVHADYCGGANSYGGNPNQVGFNERQHYLFDISDRPSDLSSSIVQMNAGATNVVMSVRIDFGSVSSRVLQRFWIQNGGTLAEASEIANDGFKIYYEAATGSETFNGNESVATLFGDYGGNATNNNQYGHDALNIAIPSGGLRIYVVLNKFNSCITTAKTAQVSLLNDGLNFTPNMDTSFSLSRVNQTPASPTAISVATAPVTGALNGTYYIPSSCFPTVASAVTYLNTNGVAGPVIFNVAAGHTETAPTGGYSITGTGTAANTIRFQKFGTGANPTLTAPLWTAGGLTDGILKIVGGDYITIDGFTFQENSGNTVTATGATNTMTEIGIGMYLTTATNGAQNNTIQNCTISLSAAFPNSIGIFSSSSSSSTNGALAATATTGTNSNNKIYGNTINNVAYGIYTICEPVTATINESGWDIGGTSSATGNTITFGATTSTIGYTRFSTTASGAIVLRNGNGANIRFNTITSNSLAYTQSNFGGILISSSAAPTGVTYTSTMSNNNVTLTNTNNTQITAIDFGHGISTGTMAGSNNTIVVNNNVSAATAAALRGIVASYTHGGLTLNNNNITFNQNTSAGAVTSAVTGINAAGTSANTITTNVNSNVITIRQNAPTGTGSYAATGSITFISVAAAQGIVNVNSNQLLTTGSTIRSTADLFAINHNATIQNLTVDLNTITIDRNSASGNIYGTYSTGTPSSVNETFTNNSITYTGLSGTTSAYGISSLDGASASTPKTYTGNTISISGTNTGTVRGVSTGYCTGSISNNNITVNTNAATVVGIDATATGNGANTLTNNTISLTSGSTSPTSMIGITAGATGPFQIHANTFTTMTFNGVFTSSPVVSGIAVSAGTGNNIYNNVVRNISVGTSGSASNPTVDGILISGGTSTNVYTNKIFNISSLGTGATGIVNGLRISGGTTNNVYNNTIGGLTASNSANPESIRGISITSAVTSTQNIFHNSIFLNATSTGANFGSTGIFHTTSATSTVSTLNLRNNIIINNSTPAGTGRTVAYRRSSTTLTNYGSTSDNNLFFAGTPGANNVIFSDGTNNDQTLADFKTRMATRDQASQTENTSFQSTTGSDANFLRIAAGTTSFAESGAVLITTPVNVNTDYWGITRPFPSPTNGGTTPDIGASEFDGIPALVNCTTPADQATSLVPGTITSNTATASFTAAASNPTGYLVVASNGTPFVGTPIDGTSYTAGQALGNGAVIQMSSSTTASNFALPSNTSGNLAIFSYNTGACIGGPKYNTVSPLTGVVTTCAAAPTANNVTSITGSTASINWTASSVGGGAGTISYIVEVSTDAGFASQISGSPFSAGTSVTQALTGLSGNTTYYYRIKANNTFCDSAYITGNFTTNQIPTTLPYSDNLNTNNFTLINGAQTNKWAYGSAIGNPANALYISSDNGVTNAYNNGVASVVQAYREIIVPNGTTNASLSFDWRGTGESCCDYLRVWLVPVTFTPTAGTQIATGGGNIQVGSNFNQQATWTTFTNNSVNLSSFAGTTMRLVFEWRNDGSIGTNPPAAIDNVSLTVPTCLVPVLTATTAITSTTATINWTAPASAPSNGYNYEVRTSGAAGSGATGLTTSGAVGAGIVTANITGLTAATSYSVYVQSNCGGSGTSSWTTAGTFTTACDVPNNPGTITVTAPSATGFTLNYAAASPAPTNYILFNSTGTVATAIPTLVNGTTYANATAYTFGGNSYNCITNTSASPQGLSGGISNTQYNYFLYSKSTTNSCFGSPYYSTGVSVSAITCPAAPTLPVSSSITSSSATVSWTASAVGGGAATINYVLEVYTDASYTTSILGSPFSVGTSVSQSLTSLNSNTPYYYRIKANNGGMGCDSAYLTGTFTTACGATNSNAGTAQSSCGGTTPVTLAANTPSVGTGAWTVTSGPSTLVSQFSSTTNPTAVFTPAGGTGAYVLTWTITSGGCSSASTVTITVNAAPSAVTITPSSSTTFCEGSSVVLTAGGGTISSTSTLGSGSSVTTPGTTASTLGPNPMETYYGGSKQQIIVTASELTSLGMSTGSVISSLAFNMSAVESRTLQNYVVKMQNTALTSFTSTTFVTSGFTTVRTAANLTPVTGWNTIPFNTNFTWNGTSNLLIEVNFSNNDAGGTGTNTAIYSTTSFASTLFYRVDSNTAALVDAAATASFAAYSSRNNMQFGFTSPGSFTWSPSIGLNTTTGATVTANPTTSTTYTVTSTINGCSNNNTVLVTVNPKPQGSLSANGPFCASGAGQLTWTATAGTGPFTVVYNDGVANRTETGVVSGTPFNIFTTPVTASTTYTLVSVTDSSTTTCARTSGFTGATATITVNPTPTTANAGPDQSVCSTNTITLAANTATSGTGAWSIVSGSGGTVTTTSSPTSTFTGTAGATYTLRWTISSGVCTASTDDVVITIFSPLDFVNLQFPESATICQGSSFTAYGQVYEADVTPGGGQGANIIVEFGYNGTNTNPSTWSNWFTASYNSTVTNNNDEYQYNFTPPTNGTFYYTFRYKQGTCDTWQYGGFSGTGGGTWGGANVSGVLTVNSNAAHTISLSSGSATPALCQNTLLGNTIVYATGGGATSAGVTGLPSGMSGSFNSGNFTINGTPTASGIFNFTVTTTGNSCASAVTASGTITVSSDLDFVNLQWPPSGSICSTGTYTVYGQVYESGVTNSAGQGSGITVQFGYNGTNSNPSTWTNWSTASYSIDSGNNDEYLYTFTPPSSGTFYYTFRYRQGSCNWIYGGYSAGGGGAWSGSNVSGILTVTAPPSAGTLGGSQAVCISDSTTFTSTSSDGSWSSSDTGVASINATTGVVTPVAAGTATMTYTVTGTGGCSNATNTRTVTVNQVTNGGTASSNQIICSGETPSAITLASSVGSVVKWQSSSDAAFTSPTDITNTSTTLTLGSLSATTYYRAVVQSGACSSANSNVVTITVNSLPTVSIASNNSPVCSGAASFSLTGTTDAVVTYNINGGTNATTTLTGGAATISVPNPFASQVLTLVSVANNGCTSSLSDTSTVSVIATTYDGTSWSNGNPDSSKLAIFTGNYTIAADLTACSLRVTNNAVVTVNSNYNVYLNGAITVDSGSSFTMNNNTNLLQSDASAVNTGNIIVKRNTSTIVRLDHTLWSSPVTGQNLFSFSPNTLVNRFYVYNTATNSYVTTGLSNTSLFTPAKGFAVRAPNNQSATTPAVWTGTFTGVPNNGTKTFTLATNAANGYNYNLVGNPYPSAISASNFYAANASKIGGTLYFYAHTLTMNASGIFPTGTNYATWTGLGGAAATAGDGHTPAVAPNGIIQVGQGFIVRATASGDVTFTNAMRVANQQNQFMKAATASAETHRMWLNLKTDTGVDVNQILVGYMDGATQGVDAGLDGLSFGNTGSYLYSKIENDNFVIQALSLPFDVTDEVPLGFNCATAGSYSISLTNTDGLFAADQDILVRDNLTGTDTSIKTVPYTFNSETGVFDTRFRLVYTQALGVPSTNFTENSVIVYKNTDWFHVNTKGIEMKDIMVYDISGRLIYSKKEINATTAVLNGLTTTNQVLILKINSIEDKTVTIKVIN